MRAFQIFIFLALTIPQITTAEYLDCPNTIDNSHKCAIYLENNLSQKNNKLFLRNGSQLEIKLKNGKKKIYIDKDDTKNVDNIIAFNFIKYFPDIAFGLIHVQYWEGGTFYFVNLNNGYELDIKGLPILSPDKKRVAVYYEDIEAHYSPNMLAVYRIDKDFLVIEFKESPLNWGTNDLRWITNEEISFLKTYIDHTGSKTEEPKFLRFRNGNWLIE